MEMKVWLDGYQRVVCGVTEQTTCQDIMIALAQASGKTGRFTMIEKWRTNERCLSPSDFPLLILQKWGEYSNDVQLILCHSRVGSGKKHRHHPNLGPVRPESSPPDRIPVKKSLTFNAAVRRASSGEQPTVLSNGRVVCHSVESSEQGSVASQSSASLSPYMSLERQTQKAEGNLSNGDFEKDFRMRQIWSPDTHLRQGSDEGATFGKPSTDGNPSRAGVPSVPVVPRSQVPIPSVRSSKVSSGNLEVGSHDLPKPAHRKDVLTVEPKQHNGSIVFESKGFHSNSAVSRNPHIISDSSKTSDVFNSSKAPTSPRSSVSSNFSLDVSTNVFLRAPVARDKNDNIVSDSKPKVLPYKMPAVKEPYLSRPPSELQNGKDRANQPGAESGLGRERPIAARRHRGPVADDSEEFIMPLRTEVFPSSNVTHDVSAAVTSRPAVKQGPSSTLTSSVETQVTSKPTATKTPFPTVATSFGATVTSRPALKQVHSSTVGPSVETTATSKPGVRHGPSSTVTPSVETTVTSKPVVKHGPSSTVAPSVETAMAPRPPVKPAPNSTVESSVTSRPTPKGPAVDDPAEQLREAKQRKELIELIGRQEREMLKCESILRELNSDISVLEGWIHAEVDGNQLETQMQMRKIEEMETVERRLDEELMELELVSWEDKLDLEKQKENRIRTEINLLQSNIAKSETEIHSNVEKIRSLTNKTEKATKELNRCLEAKKEKENKLINEVEDLESSLLQATKESETSKSALESLEEEISAADRNLTKRKEELEEVEGQLKRLNLENFVQESREIASMQRSRTPVLEMLGLSRPGSSRRRCHLSPSPLRLNRSIDETDQRPELGYVV